MARFKFENVFTLDTDLLGLDSSFAIENSFSNASFQDGLAFPVIKASAALTSKGPISAEGPLFQLIDGDEGDNVLDGTADADTINGFGGNDTLNGLGGADIINGGDGNDTLNGGRGNDTINGGAGDDTMLLGLGHGSDDFNGGAGIDTVDFSGLDSSLSTAFDLVNGTWGFITTGGSGDLIDVENIIGTAGDDIITGSSVVNALNGGDGDDIITGGLGDDTLDGGSGDDTLIGGEGADVLNGGAGIDTASYVSAAASITIDAFGDGTGGEALGDDLNDIEIVTLSNFDDTIFFDVRRELFDTINGLDGNDSINLNVAQGGVAPLLSAIEVFGGAGDDRVQLRTNIDDTGTAFAESVLDGGAGIDTLNISKGGSIDFRLMEFSSFERLDFAGNVESYELFFTAEQFSDFEVVKTRRVGTLEIHIEMGETTVLDLSGLTTEIGSNGSPQDFLITGDDDAEQITGSNKQDVITGNGGNDIITGDLGNDILSAGDGDDRVIWNNGDGSDTIDGGAGADVQEVNLADGDGDAITISANGGGTLFERTNLGLFSLDLTDIETLEINGNGGDDIIDGSAAQIELHINGGAGDDSISGGAGADILDGGDGVDALSYFGSAEGVTVNLLTNVAAGGDAAGDVVSNFENVAGSLFNDVITGGDGDNNIIGFDGNDRLDGGVGDDTLVGGDGADTLFGGAGADVMDGGAGLDSADYRASASRITLDLTTGGTLGDAAGDTYSSIERLFATDFNDRITGTNANEFFFGEGGNDVINGGGGIDRIFGGDGNDVQRGEAGNDTLFGSAGADQLNGGIGNDIANYSLATSFVSVNMASGGAVGDAAGDTYFGIESIFGSDFNDILIGNNSGNELRGGDGDDILSGSGGNDRLFGDAGADSMNGGAGADIAMYTTATEAVTVNLTTGGTVGDAAGDTYVSVEWVFATDFDDDITGDGANNRLEGRDGNDTLNGEAGNDRLLGGDGNDTINGGDGVDTLFGQNGDDIINGGAGNDFMIASSGSDSFDGGSDFDTVNYLVSNAGVTINLQTGGTGGDATGDTYVSVERVFGSQHDDIIEGSNGDDTLFGNGGNDVLRGGLGNDRLLGGAGDDEYVFDTTQDGADVFIGFLAGAAGAETIHITGGDAAFDTFAEVIAASTQIGANTVIDFGSGNRITLTSVILGDLDANDFTFAAPPASEELNVKAPASQDLSIVSDIGEGTINEQDVVAAFLSDNNDAEGASFGNDMATPSDDMNALYLSEALDLVL